MATTKTDPRGGNKVFDQAVQTFGDAIKANVKIQEEVGKLWSDAFGQVKPLNEWQRRSRAIVNDAIPAAQKNVEDWFKIIEQNYRRSMDLLKKTFDTETLDTPDLRARTQKLWEQSLEIARENAQAIAQTNMKMMELWSGILRRNTNGAKEL